MELWGGIECSINRVGERHCDQLSRSGHYHRPEDLELIAGLGIKTLRYPLLWERATARHPTQYDWSFADERLPLLRELGVTPIAGLLHHGAGPLHADIMSERFAPGLADYALSLARRFPTLEWYTPVNEPLTTARFSGLYGLWYPHLRSAHAFARILINECRATVLAMRAVRTVNPAAKLMQTDDLGTIYSTPRLAYQAEFENQRRWLGWDLLFGTVNAAHPLYGHLRSWGINEHEIEWFSENPCPPQMIGIDHYVTSDRYLDEDLERYPRGHWGGNDREQYADVDAVRVPGPPGTSLREVILEAARRYSTPVLLAEVHIGCTEDEQVRWMREAWTTCKELEGNGVDVRAVTAWALFGSYDWEVLLTSDQGRYEPGAFCLRHGLPRPTALWGYLSTLTKEASTVHPGIGWWRRPERILYGGRGRPPLRRSPTHMYPPGHRAGITAIP